MFFVRPCVATIATLVLVRAVPPWSRFPKRHNLTRPGGRIINGVPVSHEQYPYIVSIEYYGPLAGDWFTTCGGSIVNKVTILTACHCATVDEDIHGHRRIIADPAERRIVAGSIYWEEYLQSETRQIVNVSRIVTHPKCQNFPFQDKPFVNDVGLYFLKKPLVYNAQVQPCNIPSADILTAVSYMDGLIADGAWCTTVGWGRTSGLPGHDLLSEKLMAAEVKLLDAAQCRHRYCTMTYQHCKTDFSGFGQICVASPTASDCFGDSGGPLVCDGFVIGTVSYGEAPCPPTLPTVFQGLKPILELFDAFNVQTDGSLGLAQNDTNNNVPKNNTPPMSLEEMFRKVMAELKSIRILLGKAVVMITHS